MAIRVALCYLPVKFGGGKRLGLPPLGIFYIGSLLQSKGVKTSIIDASIKGLTVEQTEKAILEKKPDIIGISGLTPHVKSIIEIVGKLKGKSSTKICLGGPHFNATREEIFDYLDIDFVVYGEGEYTFLELCDKLDSGNYADIQGLIYKSNGEVRVNPPRPLISDLDALPFPDLDLGDPNDYAVLYGKYGKATSIIASRGCPFRCTFCDVYITQGRQLRLRSPQNIIDEIKFNLTRYGMREFVFKDSTFTVNRKWVHSLIDHLLKENIDISWSCNTRVDLIDGELLERMKKAGCRKISFGVESGDQEVLDNMRKGIILSQVRRAFEITHRAGIEPHAFFMIGNPGDNKQTVKKTIALAKELKTIWAAFAPTIAYPGTPLYEWAVENKALLNPQWYIEDQTEVFLSNYGSISKGQLHLKDLSPQEQVDAVKKAYRGFYFRLSWIVKAILAVRSLFFIGNLLRLLPKFIGFLRTDDR